MMQNKKQNKTLEELTAIGINNLIKKYDLDKQEVMTNYIKIYCAIGSENKIKIPEYIGYAALDKLISLYNGIYKTK